MNKRSSIAGTAALFFVAAAVGSSSQAQSGLNITYGANGLQTLSYNGQVLEDLNSYSSDGFHIWHMKATDLSGKVLGQYGWGESNNGRSWDAASKTWIYNFSWGTIQLQYIQNGNTLDMRVTETNTSGSGIILDGATLYPLVLHFPQLPAGFVDPSYAQYAFNTTAPSVTVADYGSGEVAAVAPDAGKPLYSGFQAANNGNAYTAIISSTAPDGLATFQPHNDRPVNPGQTDSFTVSLRFAPSSTPTSSLASDAYQNWASTWPQELNWSDRRIIGTAYLASSPQGNVNQPAGYPNNPRRYFNDSNASDFDVTTSTGLAQFQTRILQQAASNVQNLSRLNAQGLITWDIEGEQYPQTTSYVCSPDQIAQAAPEMESTISDPSSPYNGLHLVDAYFKTMRDAGFRVGVCVRPQQFSINADATAQQTYISDSSVSAQLIRKMRYAHDRWGVTLFYIDSSVDSTGAPLDAAIFQQAAAAFPDSLLIPEESTPRHYAYTAPFLTFLFHGDLGTDPTIYNYYPQAFSANLINDVDPNALAANRIALTNSVRRGDILMTHADYWQANNNTILQIYKEAGVNSQPVSSPSPTVTTAPYAAPAPDPTPAPTPTPIPVSNPAAIPNPAPTPIATPPPVSPNTNAAVTITSPAAGETLSGMATVQGQISLSLDPAGSYLMIDGIEVGTNRVTSDPYVYLFDTSTVGNGQHKLQLWAHDIGDNTVVSAPVLITIFNSSTSVSSATSSPDQPLSAPLTQSASSSAAQAIAPSSTYPIALNYPVAGQAVSGLIQVSATIPQTLDSAGSYLMVDGAESGWTRIGAAPYIYPLNTSTLSSGSHTLQVWAHDIGNNTLLSNPITIHTTAR